MNASWNSLGKREIYEYCGDSAGRIAVLQRPDGTLTGQHQEMDAMLREAWDEVFCLYTALPEPSWEDFKARYQNYFPQVAPMVGGDLTPGILKGVLERMHSSSSGGADGWRVAELKALPMGLLQRLCDLFNLIERLGKWPEAMAIGIITPLSKGEGLRPIDTRPITVMSAVYRLWASARVSQVLQWQASWLGMDVCSFRAGMGCEDIWWTSALRIEHSLLTGAPLAGLNVDFAKAFDRLPVDILLNLADTAGMPSNVVQALRAMYRQLQRRFKTGDFLGEPFASTNGIIQGCPLSVALLNIFVYVWTQMVQSEVPGTIAKAFADDLSLMGATADMVKKGLGLTVEFADRTGMLMNTKKSGLWATTRALRMRLTGIIVEGCILPLMTHDRLLGAYLSYNGNRIKSKFDVTFKACKTIAERIKNLPLPMEVRATLIASLVVPKAVYACAVNWPSESSLTKLRAQCTTAVWGQGNHWRAPEVVMTLLAKGHIADPVQAAAYQTITVASRVLRKQPELEQLFYDVLQRRRASRATHKGPGHAFIRALKNAHLDLNVENG